MIAEMNARTVEIAAKITDIVKMSSASILRFVVRKAETLQTSRKCSVLFGSLGHRKPVLATLALVREASEQAERNAPTTGGTAWLILAIACGTQQQSTKSQSYDYGSTFPLKEQMPDRLKNAGVWVILVFVNFAIPCTWLAHGVSRTWRGFSEVVCIQTITHTRNPVSLYVRSG